MEKRLRTTVFAGVFIGLTGAAAVQAQVLNIGGVEILLPVDGSPNPNAGPVVGALVEGLQALLPDEPPLNSNDLLATVSDNVLRPPSSTEGGGTPAIFSDTNSIGEGSFSRFSGIGNVDQSSGSQGSAQQVVRVSNFGN